MGFFKFSNDLSLAVYELRKIFSFLDSEGFRRILTKKIISQGVVGDIKIQQGQNTLSGQKTLQIVDPILAIDNFGNYVSLDAQSIPVPETSQWYWLKISHSYSNIEKGVYSIDSLGNLTSSGVDLLKMLRGQPDFPSCIKFVGSTLNPLEYNVLEVIDSSNAILQGNFQQESNLKIALVGTFTPGIVIPEANKYPFNYDSASIEFVQENIFNQPPLSGSHIWLARIKNGSSLTIQLKANYLKEWVDNYNPLNIDISNIAGIDFSRWNDKNSTCESNQVQVSWGVVSTSFQISSSNKIVLLNVSGGIVKSISQIKTGDLDGFLIYPSNGNPSKILSSVKNGSTVELVLDRLFYDDYSIDGGESFIDMELHIVPDVDFIEWKFYGDIDDQKNRVQYFKFLNGLSNGICQVKLLDYPKTNYRLFYRLFKGLNSTEWKIIESDSIGYINEFSFDDNGLLKDSNPQLKSFISDPINGFIELTGFTHSYVNIKNILLKNKDGVDNIIFQPNVQTIHIFPTVSKKIQLITAPGALSSAFNLIYINIQSSKAIEGTKFVFHLGGNVQIGDRTLKIVSGFVNPLNPGTVLKELTKRDFSEAKNVTGGLKIEFTYSGSEWVVSQSYKIGPKGEIVMFSGTSDEYNECFDGSGLGKSNGWIGYAVCNGSNNTPNLIDKFARGTSDPSKINTSGGSNNFKLTLDNIPEHTHNFITHWKKVGKNAGSGEDALYRSVNYYENQDKDFYDSSTSKSGAKDPQSINNIPEFNYVVYVKRLY